MSNNIYGYCRISTPKQSIKRQVDNIKTAYPDAIIIEETWTGTTLDRPKWNSLKKNIQTGDTIVFDELSRMSRDASEGFNTYKDLYANGINLIFLKESTLNTENFRATEQTIAMTGTEIDCILKGINEYLMILAENQIKAAFATSEHEVQFLRKRTSEGVRQAQKRYKKESALGMQHEKKSVGRQANSKIVTKKATVAKLTIRKYSKDFDGSLEDKDVITLAKISRNSYYKYKAQLKAEIS